MAEALTDDVLLSRAGRGDERAFVALYQRHRDPIYRFIRRLCGSRELAEDVTHDCFLGLIQRPQQFNPARASLRTYLCAAARNLAISRLRRTWREEALDGGPGGEAPEGWTPTPLGRVLSAELQDAVGAAVAALPPLQREAVILFEYEDMTLAQIAEVAAAEVGTIKSRLHRARQQLRRALSGYLNGDAVVQAKEESR